MVLSYVNAIVADAEAADAWAQWDQDLNALAQIGADRALAAAISARGTGDDRVSALLGGILGERGLAISEILAAEGHFELVGAIYERFVRRSATEGPLDRVLITAAGELTDRQIGAISNQLTKPNRQVVMQTRIDPDLIGGIIVRIGDWRYDFSVRSRLESLRRSIN